MKFTVLSFGDGQTIPAEFAMGIPAEDGPATFGPNRSPHLAWFDAPEGTRSFALICHDPDAPTVGDDVNQPGRTVPYDLPRADFYHWVLVDIPADVNELPAGCDCEGVTPRGKVVGSTPYGLRGINSYTSWFAGNPAMEGDYGGYDGPFPPWNDERVHRYVFTLYALDVPSLGLTGAFDGADALLAMKGHILESANWVGTYAIFPEAKMP
jgi:Raf kinase inhibitor-like YbhB/YbcL family protein